MCCTSRLRGVDLLESIANARRVLRGKLCTVLWTLADDLKLQYVDASWVEFIQQKDRN